MKVKGIVMVICAVLLVSVVPVSAKRLIVREHDGTHDWVHIDSGDAVEGFPWLDILGASVELDGEFFVLSMNVRGRVPLASPDGLDMAYWWGFDTDMDLGTGYVRGVLDGIGQDCAVRLKYHAVGDYWDAFFFAYDAEGNQVEGVQLVDFEINSSHVVVLLPAEYLGVSEFYWRTNTHDYYPSIESGGVDVAPDTGHYVFG